MNARSLVKNLTKEYTVPDKFRLYHISKANLHADDDWKCDILYYVLTPAGKELYQFVEVQQNMDYLSVFANFLKEKNAKLEYAPIVSKDGDEVIIKEAWTQVQP